MAFDFVSYISSALATQQGALLPEQATDERISYLQHLIAFDLEDLIQQFATQPQHAYTQLREQPTQLVHQTSAAATRQITASSDALAYFAPIAAQLPQLIPLIAQRIVDELHQLDDISSLGAEGISELLAEQHQHMQPLVEHWYWPATGQEEPLHPDAELAAVDMQQALSSFNQMLQEQTTHVTEPMSPDRVTLAPTPVPTQPSVATTQSSISSTRIPVSPPHHRQKKAIYLLMTIVLVLLSGVLLWLGIR